MWQLIEYTQMFQVLNKLYWLLFSRPDLDTLKRGASPGFSWKGGAKTSFASFVLFKPENDKFSNKKGVLTLCTPLDNATVFSLIKNVNLGNKALAINMSCFVYKLCKSVIDMWYLTSDTCCLLSFLVIYKFMILSKSSTLF